MAYDPSFYNGLNAQSEAAAKKIAPIIKKYLDRHGVGVRSVLDVGCGNGVWIQSLGESFKDAECAGYDFHDGRCLTTPTKYYRTDFNNELPANGYDLVICLEVAEHLPVERAEAFIRELCRISGIVVFSAAAPHQGGHHHINEQWQSYWAKLFSENGFKPYDFIRPLIWGDPDIRYFYQQNTIMYSRLNFDGAVDNLRALDVVHPELYNMRTDPGGVSIKNIVVERIKNILH